jgi:UDP-GlcNAc:undecaprenyl-phosphate GlcNAc-1-phosphate transferase
MSAIAWEPRLPSELIAFSVALAASLGMTVPIRRLALNLGLVDRPGPRKVHLTPIPLLGGLAIYVGVFLAIIITLRGPTHAQIVSILAGATLLAVVGILDDGGLLNHQVKLFIGMPGAALILLASGIHAQVFSTFLPDSRGTLLDGGLTVFWVVGITAAFSILDHMDGLCAGVAAVAAGFFMISASMNGQVMVRTLAAAALGAALGFLRWNFNPAKIFMGDGGAMFIGFLMAALGLKLRPEEAPSPASWLIPLFILGVPIFDTALVSISRARRGLVPFTSPGKDHTAHRLVNLGLSTRGAVLSMYALGALCGGGALLIPHLSVAGAYSLAGAAALLALCAIFFLERAPYERQKKLEKSPSLT